MVAGGRMTGKGQRVGMDMDTLLYLKWITNKGLLYNMELGSVLCGSLDGGEVLGRMDTCIYMAESLCCSLETTTTLLGNWLYIKTKSFKQKEKDKWNETRGYKFHLQFQK